MSTVYRHTQIGTLTLVFLLISLAIAAAIGESVTWHPALLAMIAFTLVLGFLFSSLTVEIRDRILEVRFGPGWIRRRLPLDQIHDARPVRNRWYYGWGIRLTPRGWMWNVSGLDAVLLDLGGGRRFVIGTDEPAALAAAIQRNK